MELPLTRRHGTSLIFGSLLSLLFTPTFADEREAIVKDIRVRYDQIEGAKLRAEELEFTSDSDPVAGTFTRYFQGNTLVKIKLTYSMGDHGGSNEYFYYDNGALFFAFATDSAWGFSGETLPNGESGTIDTAIEHRIYLRDGAIIRHLSREVKSKDPEALTALLKKAPNVPSIDSERSDQLSTAGQSIFNATDGSEVLRILVP